MSFVTFLPVVLALGICFSPVWLLRRMHHSRAQDYFVSSQTTRPEVIRNSSIAYGLRMAAFGPLFAWGASGDLWPAIIGSAFFGLGIYLIYVLRQPLLDFQDGALSRDQSITVHEFMARHHGNDPRVRLLAASLTVLALLGLLIGEALGVAAVLKPVLPKTAATVYLFVIGAVLLMVLHAIPSGHTGVMHSAQLQLGMVYLGLFGSAVVFLYLHVSALTPVPPYGAFAIVSATAYCAIMLCYRRSKYVDTDPIRRACSDAAHGHASLGARALSRFGKIFNVSLSVLLVLIIVVAFLGFQVEGLPHIMPDSVAALRTGTRVSGMALTTLCLLPLFYPLVDVTNWQRLAAARKDMSSSGVEPARQSAVLRGIFRIYAVESSLGWLFMCMLGVIAVIAIETPGAANALQVFVVQITSEDKQVGVVAFPLLLIFAFSAALSTMSALFSASLCTIRYDILAAFWPELAPGEGQASKEATATRRTLVAGGGLSLAFAAAFCVADVSLQISFPSNTFLALLFASCCAQLSFVPLVVGPIIVRTRGGLGTVSPAWALVILGFGTASGVAAVTVYLATGTEPWLWAAIPSCLGSGLVLFAIARAHHVLRRENPYIRS